MVTLESYIRTWPHGHIRTYAEIIDAGVSKQEVQHAVRRQLLKSIGHGGYARNEDEISWQHGLHSLQCNKDKIIQYFVGGTTALLIHSYGNIPKNLEVNDFYYTDAKYPTWFKRLAGGNSSFIKYNAKIPISIRDSFTKFMTIDGFQYVISSPERALFEIGLTHKDIIPIKNIILSLQCLNVNTLNSILKFSFPYDNYSNFKILAENLNQMGKSELLKSLLNFIPGDSAAMSWIKISGKMENNNA